MIENGNALNLIRATQKNALITFIDLCGTRDLYSQGRFSLKTQSEHMVKALIETFMDAFMNTFDEIERRDHFYVNIFGDSIVVAQRAKTEQVEKKMFDFSKRVQNKLFFHFLGPRDTSKSVASRVVMIRGPFFSLHMSGTESADLFDSRFIRASICGGRTILEADKILKGLPAGIYMEKDLAIAAGIGSDLMLSVKDGDTVFIKYRPGEIDTLVEGQALQSYIRTRTRGTDKKVFERIWQQWIDANTGKLAFIK